MPGSRIIAAAPGLVRTRRAYFDCRFGQLHVRTAFPATGGFDEGVTLICLHREDGSSRDYTRFLPEIAEDRSVYAPDLPGFGESDGAPGSDHGHAAEAIADFAQDLRLRKIDLLGMRFGAGVALHLAGCLPNLVRKLVLWEPPSVKTLESLGHECLLMCTAPGPIEDNMQWRNKLPNSRTLDASEYTADLFDAAPKTLAKQVRDFLSA